MLKCEVTNEKTKIEVNSNVVDLSFEITMLLRNIIKSIKEENATAGNALFEFCKTVLPNLIDPDLDDDQVGEMVEKEAKKKKKEKMKKMFSEDPNALFDLLGSLLDDDEDDE